MRFLIDAQLPPVLCRWLADQGHDAIHVQDLAMAEADDTDIWAAAVGQNRIVVTKDEDFTTLRQRSATGPSVCWLRVGNVTNPALFEWLEPRFAMMLDALSAGEHIIELR